MNVKYIVNGTTGSGSVRKKDLITSQMAYMSVVSLMGVRPIIPRINNGVVRELAELTVVECIFDAIDLQSRTRDTVCRAFSERDNRRPETQLTYSNLG